MSAGTTKLWAHASKEWVIPSRPKPGRKPKKDTSAVDSQEDEEAKGRRIQNRAAQRAFRERKQSQLAELQARLLAYEQGEIERNVALQKIAKRLKEDNEKLLQENAALKDRVAKLEEQLRQPPSETNDKKRWRDDTPQQNRTARKRTKTSVAPPSGSDPSSSMPSPATTVMATPEDSTPPPLPAQSFTIPADMSSAGFTEMLDFSSSMKDVTIEANFPQFGCGFCTDETPCMCRELAISQMNDSAPQDLMAGYKLDPFAPTQNTELSPTTRPKATTTPSILENLPAYQPPVPLRRRPLKSVKPIFPIYSNEQPRSSSSSRTDATCSGDPSNCAACSDDPFGKAFCSAIEETVNSRARCESCPSRHLDGILDSSRPGVSTLSGCCGSLVGCGTCPGSSSDPPVPTSSGQARTIIQYEPDAPLEQSEQQGSTSQGYIPTNDAWRRIKAHPNAQFADLSLLAEVVSSRAKCTGPRIVITPPPEQKDHFHIKQEVPQLVPQEVLLECGRRRVREVHSDAVRDALRLLDAKFT